MSFNLQNLSGLSGCFSKAGLAIATTTSQFKITNATPYAIDGKLYSKATTDNIAFAVVSGTLTNLAINQACALLVCLDAAGNAKVVQGPIVASGDKAPVPFTPDGYATIGSIKVDGGGSVFTFGTTALIGGTVTVTYTDYAANPGGSI